VTATVTATVGGDTTTTATEGSRAKLPRGMPHHHRGGGCMMTVIAATMTTTMVTAVEIGR